MVTASCTFIGVSCAAHSYSQNFRSSVMVEFSNVMEVVMTYESRRLAGILLIVLPTVMFGGVSILSLLIGDPTYMQNSLRQDLWRAGHAHAGVWLILALVVLRYVDEANLSDSMKWLVRSSVPRRRHPRSRGVFLVCAVAQCHSPERIDLARLCRRSAAGRRRARPRRRTRQAPCTKLLDPVWVFSTDHPVMYARSCPRGLKRDLCGGMTRGRRVGPGVRRDCAKRCNRTCPCRHG